MSPELANFLFEAVNFLVLAGALGWLLFKPIRAALEAESTAHDAARQELDTARQEMESLAEKTRTERDGLEAEIARERVQMKTSAEREIAQMRDQAQRAQAAETERLQLEAEAHQAAQAQSLADALGQVAAVSIRRLLDNFEGPSLDVALVRGACAQLADLPAGGRILSVESARALTPDAHEMLRAALGAEFEERLVPELGAGVRITTSKGQVDATAISISREAAREVSRTAAEPGTPDA